MKKSKNYKDGRTLKKHYCVGCNKEINFNTALYKTGKCSSCSKIGRKVSKKTRAKNNITRSHGRSVELS